MNTGLSPDTKQRRFADRFISFGELATVAAIIACAAIPLFVAHAAQRELPPNTLWEVVQHVCVPGQSEHRDPRPCVQVDLSRGIERGFAILRDPRGGTQFLLVPTTRITGIESPEVRGTGAPNYFDNAWEARTFINEALHQTLSRDDIGLAINSAISRSQDQLHIHFSCIRPDVFDVLHRNEERIGNRWAALNVPLVGRHYIAMWVAGEHLSPNNPFSFLAESMLGSTPDMANRTLVVIGFTRADGTRGFVILADRINEQIHDLANGEELLDRSCSIATMGSKTHVGLIEPGTK